jgi:hypothetical protein
MAATQTRLAASPPRTGRRTRKRTRPLAAAPPPTRLDEQVRNYAQCRALGHEWQHRGPVDEPGSGVAFGARGLRSVCSQCQMERIKWLTRSGEVHARYYQPEGYAQHGEDKLNSRQWRSAFVTIVFGS